MRTYVCTCGTSIATNKGISLDRFYDIPLAEYNSLLEEIDSVKALIAEELSCVNLPAELDDTSAEIKSLTKMGLNKNDSVVLLASETVDGKLCAEAVRAFLVEHELCPESSVEIKVVIGLQATNGIRFRKEGLKNLLNYLVSLEHQDIVFNITGGYKSVVPYVALMGMIFNREVKYVHEESEDVITLTGIPLIIDDDLILRIESKFRKIEQNTAISRKEWQEGIDYHDRRFNCLVEEDNNMITLSGIGLMFWDRFKQDFPEELLRDGRPSSDKENRLLRQGLEHHGLEKLKPIANRLLRSPFVTEVPNSCENKPESKQWIKAITATAAKNHIQREEDGLCIVTDINSDPGYSFLIKTTARNYNENKKIARILNRKYFK